MVSILTPAEILIAARRLAGARPHLAAVAGIVHREDLWQLCRDELTGADVRIDGWDIRGRWFGVVAPIIGHSLLSHRSSCPGRLARTFGGWLRTGSGRRGVTGPSRPMPRTWRGGRRPRPRGRPSLIQALVPLLQRDCELRRLSRVQSIFGGTTEIMKEIIGRNLGL